MDREQVEQADLRLAYVQHPVPAQGVTTDTTHLIVADHATAEGTYVALTRAREQTAHPRQRRAVGRQRARADRATRRTGRAQRARDPLDRAAAGQASPGFAPGGRSTTRRSPSPRTPERQIWSEERDGRCDADRASAPVHASLPVR